ncbi:MAG: hypothetical protein E6767_12955 [Dysgonomonas sp.]|nr:hypothetical protein [Dysgonomonas sp.]
MIAVILCWLLITLVFFALGDNFISVYQKVTKRDESYSFFDTFLIGLCVTGTLICITSIWLPSGLVVASVLGLLSAVYLFFAKRKQLVLSIKSVWSSLSLLQKILIPVVFLLFLLFALMPPQFPDIYYYHIQNMMWNEEFHVVPGLANLEERFGFNSNLFLLCSTFGLRPLFGQFVFGINALCMAFLLINIIRQSSNKKPYLICIYIVIYIILFMVYKTHIAASSADLLPNLLIVYLLFSLLSNQKNLQTKSILFWLLPVFCITLKVSAVFICLLSMYFLIILIKEKSYKTVGFICIVALLIVVPWLARNVIISGYLVHPYPAIDLFNVDWKLPAEYARQSSDYIKAFALNREASGTSAEYVLSMPLMDKIRYWISEQHPLDISIALSGLLSPLFMLVGYKRIVRKDNAVLNILWLIGFAGFVFWLTMAPAVRFGYGFMAIVVAIFFYLILKDVKYPQKVFPVSILIILSIVYLSVLTIRYFVVIKDVSYVELLLKPQDIGDRRTKDFSSGYINDILFVRPINGGCGDHSLPCSNEDIEGLEMRGNTLQEGFRREK